MESKYVLVTGGAGYIGTHLCKLLKCEGYIPIIYDNLSRSVLLLSNSHIFEYGDIGDSIRLTEVIKKYNPIAVIHLAGYIVVSESIENPIMYYDNHIKKGIDFLRTLKMNNINKIIFSSSAAVYGNSESNELLNELNSELSPLNPYGKTKLMFEELLNEFGFDFINLRYFNVSGGLENHSPETHLIPLLFTSYYEGPVKIYGDDHNTEDGTCIRDYVHIDDICIGHLKALEKLLERDETKLSVNLGSGIGYSIKTIINKMTKLCSAPNIKYVERRDGEPSFLVADISFAKDFLNWSPKFTIDDILLDYLD